MSAPAEAASELIQHHRQPAPAAISHVQFALSLEKCINLSSIVCRATCSVLLEIRNCRMRGASNLLDGVLNLSDGHLKLSDGALNLLDGVLKLSDGVLELSDGDLKLQDGDLKLSDGSLNLLDGVLNLPGGDSRLSDGDLNLSDGDLNLLCADLETNVPRMLAKSRRRRKKYSKNSLARMEL